MSSSSADDVRPCDHHTLEPPGRLHATRRSFGRYPGMGRYNDAASGDARGTLIVALMEQSIRHERDVKEKGGPAAFLTEWMGKHPDPTKVGDFVSNLLCVPSSQVRQLLDAGQP